MPPSRRPPPCRPWRPRAWRRRAWRPCRRRWSAQGRAEAVGPAHRRRAGIRQRGPAARRGKCRCRPAAREKRTLRPFNVDQPSEDERPRGTEAGTSGTRCKVHTAHRQCQGDRRAPPGDVVVQISVEPLEPGVKVRSDRDQQQLHVQGMQPECPGKVPEPDRYAARLRFVCFRLRRLERSTIGVGEGGAGRPRAGGPRPTGEQLVHLRVGHVQAQEPVVRSEVGTSAGLHRRADP